MYVNGRKSKYIFQKIHYNKNVLRATSEQKTSNPFFIIMKTNINSRIVLSFSSTSFQQFEPVTVC